MAVEVSRRRFERLVDRALESVPRQLLDLADNVVVEVADENADEPGLLGLYWGIALTERGTDYTFAMPDTIYVYRLPLLELAADEAELEHEIRVTVVHELAHHFGIDDDRLHELGWG
ncbi:metallopeptidase family protein [Jatrophihabitans sp. YIM 134969]